MGSNMDGTHYYEDVGVSKVDKRYALAKLTISNKLYIIFCFSSILCHFAFQKKCLLFTDDSSNWGRKSVIHGWIPMDLSVHQLPLNMKPHRSSRLWKFSNTKCGLLVVVLEVGGFEHDLDPLTPKSIAAACHSLELASAWTFQMSQLASCTALNVKIKIEILVLMPDSSYLKSAVLVWAIFPAQN